ncbi:MAG: EamA family transporter [Proteobacteria bacterium]|nr:EamA family transporter [Pseudomonadota bacterium]
MTLTDDEPTRRRSLVAIHAAAVLFGCTGVLGAAIALPAIVTTCGRAAIAATTLVLVARVRRVPLAGAWRFAGNGALLAVHWTTFFASVATGGVAIAVLGFASFPLFALPLESWLLGRRWHVRDTVTAALVTLGIALLAGATLGARTLQLALVYGLLSGFSFAWLAVRNRAQADRAPPLAQAFGQNLWAALWLVPLVLLLAARDGLPPITPTQVLWLAVLGVLCTALAHTLFIAALRRLSAHTASVIVALEPVYGIALAIVLLGQVPTWSILAGGVLIVVAVVAAARHDRGSAPPPVC